MSVPRPYSSESKNPDIVVVGAGLIGLAIALELHDRGAAVTVIERGPCFAGASMAAAGMLAAGDPNNPPELEPLSQLSVKRYPAFLQRIEELSGVAVPFQTQTTVQYLANGTAMRLAEQSLDPRQLAAALLKAVNETSVRLLQHTRVSAIEASGNGLRVQCRDGAAVAAAAVVNAAGAWAAEAIGEEHGNGAPIKPRKGQMLRVRLPPTLELGEVHRSEQIYIVPRTVGSETGTALIGATVEDAGFDTSVHLHDLRHLRALAADLLPELATETDAPAVEAWAGLRPFAPDSLPVLGEYSRAGIFIAGGHYRNGILLTPATAVVLADLIEGRTPALDIASFSPARFRAH